MTHPLFIDDGYTVKADIPKDPSGLFPAFSIHYRPMVGPERSEWLAVHNDANHEVRLAMTRKIIAEHCLDINGLGKLDDKKLKTLNDNALFAIRDYVLLLDARAIQQDGEAAKN